MLHTFHRRLRRQTSAPNRGPEKRQSCPRSWQITGRNRLTHRLPVTSGGFSLYQSHNCWSHQAQLRHLGNQEASQSVRLLPPVDRDKVLPRPSSARFSPPASHGTHLIGLQVSREEAASCDGLISSQINGHHGLLLVFLTQFHHLRGPGCGQGAHQASVSSSSWEILPECLLADPSTYLTPYPRPA